jgi:bifunctional N-acetylglucosamine-1-phosphate-uridyltransferase/glucosamine-1-phosphate-acetyltransferase GlmU-like protein
MVSDAEQAGYTVKLTETQFKQFQGMNRRQRLAALAQQRREAKRKK